MTNRTGLTRQATTANGCNHVKFASALGCIKWLCQNHLQNRAGKINLNPAAIDCNLTCAARIFDGYGPHERVGFALRNLENELNDGKDVEELDPSANVGAIIWLFPGMSFAGAFRERMTCSLVLPTTNVNEYLYWCSYVRKC